MRSRTRKAHYEPLVLSVMRTISDHSMLLNCNLAYPYPGIGGSLKSDIVGSRAACFM